MEDKIKEENKIMKVRRNIKERIIGGLGAGGCQICPLGGFFGALFEVGRSFGKMLDVGCWWC